MSLYGIRGVYKIVCSTTKKCYVGSSKSIGPRWAEHRNYLRKNKHPNIKLQRAWNKYGEAKFSIVVLRVCKTDEEAIAWEGKYIVKLCAYRKGYNCMSSATMWNSPEVKKKVSAAAKALHASGALLEHNRRNIASGVCHNAIQRQKASEHLKQLHRDGMVHTPRMKALASIKAKQLIADGVLNTPEQLARLAKRTKAWNKSGKMNSPAQRKRASERMKLMHKMGKVNSPANRKKSSERLKEIHRQKKLKSIEQERSQL